MQHPQVCSVHNALGKEPSVLPPVMLEAPLTAWSSIFHWQAGVSVVTTTCGSVRVMATRCDTLDFDCCLLSLFSKFSRMLQALRDLADPAEGVYNATALLDTRLKYIVGMLDKYQKVPGGPVRVSNYLTAGIPISKDVTEEEEEVSTGQQLSDGANEAEQTIRNQLNNLASNAAQFVRSASFNEAPAQQNNTGNGSQEALKNSTAAAAGNEKDAGKGSSLLLGGGKRSSIDTELTDFRRQNQNSNNAVSFDGLRRRIAMFITSDDL